MPRDSPQGMAAIFSPGHPAILEKVTRLEIEDLSGCPMFFYSCNPDPGTKVNEHGAVLAERSLFSQWKWLKDKLNFYASLLSTRASFMLIVPEQTKDGNIHFHAVVRPHNGFDEHDVKRTFWHIMECNVTNAKVRKHAVNIKPINNSGVVDYLFHKDAHDYETIFNRSIGNDKPFQPLLLHNHNVIYPGALSSSEESGEESTPPTRVFRKRVGPSVFPQPGDPAVQPQGPPPPHPWF